MTKGTPKGTHFLLELLGFLVSFAVFVFTLRETLYYGHTTFAHDNYYWNFPIFHFFAENILQGHFPWWNPYSHAGEPFYPLLVQLRLLEPLTILTVWLTSRFTVDLGILFAWHKISLNLFFLFGIYLFLRTQTKYLWTRLSLIPILLFSSLMLSSFAADGVTHNFLWIPYLFYFLHRLFFLGNRRWSTYFGLTLSLGVNFQSYFFSVPTTFLVFFLCTLLCCYRPLLKAWWKAPGSFTMTLGSALFIVLFLMPNYSLLRESSRFIYPARRLPPNYQTAPPLGSSRGIEGSFTDIQPSFSLDYAAVKYSGSFSTLWNYAQAFSPQGNYHIHAGSQGFVPWGDPSEVYFYIGIFPLILALLGFFFVRVPLAKLARMGILVFILLSLGPNGGLHSVLYPFLPSLWFLRHCQFFMPIVVYFSLFFYVWGFDWLLSHKAPRLIPYFVLVICLDLGVSFNQSSVLYSYFYHPRWLLGTNPQVEPPTPPVPREIAPTFIRLSNPQSQAMRYLDLLYRKSFLFSVVKTPAPEGDFFNRVRYGERWDSLFLLKNYAQLIHTQSNSFIQQAAALHESSFRFMRTPVSPHSSSVTLRGSFEPAMLHWQSYAHSNLKFSLDLRDNGLLYWADSFDPQWKAFVDGRESFILQANQNFKALFLLKGSHSIQFEYDPKFFRISLFCFWGVFLLCLGGLLEGVTQFYIKRTSFRIKSIVSAYDKTLSPNNTSTPSG